MDKVKKTNNQFDWVKPQHQQEFYLGWSLWPLHAEDWAGTNNLVVGKSDYNLLNETLKL